VLFILAALLTLFAYIRFRLRKRRYQGREDEADSLPDNRL